MRFLLSLFLCLAAIASGQALASIGATFGECVLKYGVQIERKGDTSTFIDNGVFYIVDCEPGGGRAERMLVGNEKDGHPDLSQPLPETDIPSLLKAVNGSGAWVRKGQEWENGSLRALLANDNAALKISRETPPKAVVVPTPADLDVTSMIVKHVKVPGVFYGVNEVYRYFFIVKNRGKKSFNGSVEITLINKTSGPTSHEAFQCEIAAKSGTTGYFDTYTGPERFHGEYGIIGFMFQAKVENTVVAKGKGALSSKFEDLTKY